MVKRSKVRVTRPLYSPPCWHVRQLQRWALERVGREKLLLCCRLLGRAKVNLQGAVAYCGGLPRSFFIIVGIGEAWRCSLNKWTVQWARTVLLVRRRARAQVVTRPRLVMAVAVKSLPDQWTSTSFNCTLTSLQTSTASSRIRSVYVRWTSAPYGLQDCKNRPALFPGRMLQ